MLCVCVCVSVCVCVCVYVCMCLCVCVYACVYVCVSVCVAYINTFISFVFVSESCMVCLCLCANSIKCIDGLFVCTILSVYACLYATSGGEGAIGHCLAVALCCVRKVGAA
jgi:hypothetical protein